MHTHIFSLKEQQALSIFEEKVSKFFKRQADGSIKYDFQAISEEMKKENCYSFNYADRHGKNRYLSVKAGVVDIDTFRELWFVNTFWNTPYLLPKRVLKDTFFVVQELVEASFLSAKLKAEEIMEERNSFGRSIPSPVQPQAEVEEDSEAEEEIMF